jgi:hypothetical protein
MWKIFRRLIKRAFCSRAKYYPAQLDVPLDTPLGPWLPSQRHVQHKFYRTNNTLFQRTDSNSFQRFTATDNPSIFTPNTTRDSLPPEAHPIETSMNGDNLQPSQQYDLILPPRLPATSSTDDLEIVDGARVRSARTILAASDSSVDPIYGRATFNWRITTTRKVGLISKCDVVRSNPKYMNSYRGEFAGLNSLITWLLENSFHTKIVKIVCDNRSFFDILQDLHIQLTDLDKAEADLILDTRRKLSKFAQVTVEWVKGHQDDSVPYEDLPFEAQLNVDCDHGAKSHLATISTSTTCPEPLPGSKATLYIGPHMVTTELNEQIQYASQAPKLFEYIADKFSWTDAQVSTVNWRGLGRAKNRLDRYRSIQTSKWIYEWLNFGSQKVKMGRDGTCPCCGKCIKDQLHLFRCEHPEMVETFNKLVRKFKIRLIKDGITTPVFTAFTNMVCKVAGKPPLSRESYCTEISDVFEAQETLGIEAIIRGIHHVDWAYLLQKTWVPPAILPNGNRERRKDPLEQSVSFIRGVWDIFEEIWACRNSILHSNHSKLLERTDVSATSRLMEF